MGAVAPTPSATGGPLPSGGAGALPGAVGDGTVGRDDRVREHDPGLRLGRTPRAGGK